MGTPSHPNRTVRVKDLNRFRQKLAEAGVTGLRDVGYDTTDKKLTKNVGGSNSDIVTAKKIATDGMDGLTVELVTTTSGDDTVKTYNFS